MLSVCPSTVRFTLGLFLSSFTICSMIGCDSGLMSALSKSKLMLPAEEMKKELDAKGHVAL